MIYDNQRFCRYCKSYDQIDRLVYYAHCSYAHPRCLLEHRGMKWLAKLHTWQYDKIYYSWLIEFGILEAFKAHLRTRALVLVRKRFGRVGVRGLPIKKGSVRVPVIPKP